MTFVTLEVEIDHGRVFASGPEPLPEKGKGLLTLLTDAEGLQSRGSISDFITKWAGSFSLPKASGDDPRLDYLISKHAK